MARTVYLAEKFRNDKTFLVPKLYSGTSFVPAKFHFTQIKMLFQCKIGNEIASASTFPSATWERGNPTKIFLISMKATQIGNVLYDKYVILSVSPS